MALSLDGSAHGSSTSSTTATATLTTASSSDVIIAFVVAIDKGGGTPSITSVAGGGLTWTKRQGISGFNPGGSSHAVIEEWWAPAASPLSSQVITATAAFTGSADHVTIHVFGVNGCPSISSPFDSNASAKASFTYSSGVNQSTATAANVAQVTTDSADTFIPSFWFGGMGTGASNTAGSGMTGIAVDNNAGGTNFDETTSQYVIKSAAQTNFGTVFSNTSVNNYVVLADALTGDSSSATSTIDQTLPAFTQEVDATASVPNTIAQTLFAPTQSLAVLAPPTGSWGSTEAKDVMAFTGHVPAAVPVFVTAGAVAHQANGTSVTPALPASRVNGNYLIAMVGVSANRTFTFPAGWTTIDSFNDGNVSAAYAYRVVDGTETDPAITWTTNTEAVAKVWQFSGVVTIGTNLAKVGDPGNNATLTNPGLTTTAPNSLVVLLGFGNNGSISGTPTGYTAISNENPSGFALGAFGEGVTTFGSASTAVSESLSTSMRWISFEFELASTLPTLFAAWASTETKDVWASLGSLIGGSWHSTEAKDIASMSGFVPLAFAIGLTEPKDVANFSVFEPPFGVLAATEAKDAFVGIGTPTPPLSIDARFTGGASGSSSVGITSATVAVTTAFKDDIIVLGIQSGGFWHQGAVTSISDTSGLFWQRRNQRQVNQNHLNGTTDSWMEEWWAHAPTPISTTVTVNTNPTGAIAIEAVAVAGANHTRPFDTHTGAAIIVDNYTGNVIDPAGRGHFGNPAVLMYTDSTKTLTLAFHGSPDVQADTSVPAGFTFLGRSEHDEGSGNTLFMASMAKVESTQQFGTTDVWFGPDATHINNRYLIIESIVASDQSASTDGLIRWYFDGTGNRTITQFGTGQTSTTMNLVTFRESAIVVVAVLTLTSANARVDHISDDGNHSGWTRRSIVTDSSGAVCLETWWVEMAEPFSGNVTINMNTSIQNGDYVSAVCFGLHGADLFQRGEIWDGNGSLPAVAHGTTGHQTVGPFDTSNDNVLVLAFGANIDTTTNNVDPTGKNKLPFLQLPAPGELVSDGPPSFNIALDYKFSEPVVVSSTAEIDISPAAQSWLMIADAIAVGPVSPPHGTMTPTEPKDTFNHVGDFSAIGIAASQGWVAFPPNPGALAVAEVKDKTTNSGAFTAIWDINGWIAYVPAFMALASAERDDTLLDRGWILGNRTIRATMHATEARDRLGFSSAFTFYNRGDRSGRITVTTNATLTTGVAENLVNGIKSNGSPGSIQVADTQAAAMEFTFDFGVPTLVNEATWYQNGPFAQPGSWLWLGSNDLATFTTLTASPFTLDGGNIGSVIGDISANTSLYRYYRLIQTTNAGGSDIPQLWEIEFKEGGNGGAWASTEAKDRFSGNMLAIPTATPIPARKRRVLIVS